VSGTVKTAALWLSLLAALTLAAACPADDHSTVPPVPRVDQRSAGDAVGKALPGLPEATRAALVSLITTLSEGQSLGVTIDGRHADFRIEGGRVALGPPLEGPGLPRGIVGSCALVYRTGVAVDLDRAQARLERAEMAVSRAGEDAVSYVAPESGNLVTVTSGGLLFAWSKRPADGLEVTDQLSADTANAIRWLGEINAALAQATDDPTARSRLFYSDPPYTHREAWLLLTSERSPRGAFVAPWARGLPRSTSASLDVPDVTLAAARLRAWVAGEGSLPSFELDGKKVIEGVEGDVGGGRGTSRPVAAADILERLKKGRHELKPVGTRYGAPCALCLEIVLPAGTPAGIELTAGSAVPFRASRPMSDLLADWPELRGLVPEVEQAETAPSPPAPLPTERGA